MTPIKPMEKLTIKFTTSIQGRHLKRHPLAVRGKTRVVIYFRHARSGCVLPALSSHMYAVEVASGLAAAEFQIRWQIIWAKQHFALSRGHYHWQHEPCWYSVRRGHKSNWRGDRPQSTVWPVANLNSFGGKRDEIVTGHGTQKVSSMSSK